MPTMTEDLAAPQIFVEVQRKVAGKLLIVRRQIGLTEWIHSFQPSGMSDRMIHECLGELGWRP